MADDVDEAVSFFKNCDAHTKVKGNIRLQLALEKIHKHATTHGLSPGHIIDLVDVAASGVLVQTVSKRLVKALIPASHVPQEAAVRAVSWMCTNKPPMLVQCMIIRWLLIVYNYMDHYDKLHSLYGLFFQFLDTESLLPHVCHLLYLLTRREDIRMFRVRQLNQLQSKYGDRPYIVGLLSLYKLYYPNLIVTSAGAKRQLFFRSSDREWKEAVNKVQRANKSPVSGQVRPSAQLQPIQPLNKRRKGIQIPGVHSLSDTIYKEDNIPMFTLSVDIYQVPFTQISGLQDLVNNIDKVEFPSQIAAAISNHLLQHVIAYKADKTVIARFNYWLRHVLSEDVTGAIGEEYNSIESLLQHLVELCDFLHEGLPVVDDFLHQYLLVWDGCSYQAAVFELLSRARLVPFHVLAANVLEPLRQLFFSSSVYIKCRVIVTLTELMHNFAATEWHRHVEMMQVNDSMLTEISQSSSLPLDAGVEKEGLGEFKGLQTLQGLAHFTEELLLVGVQAEEQNSLLLYYGLLFIDELASVHLKFKVPFVGLPTTPLLGFALFGGNAACCAILCSIMCKFKTAVRSLREAISEGILQNGDLGVKEDTGMSNINTFNHTLINMSDSLWRSRTFTSSQEQSFVGNLDPMAYLLPTARPHSGLSIYRHQAFLPFVHDFLQQRLAGDLTHPQQLKPVRDVLVQFLSNNHLSAFKDFYVCFMRPHSAS